MLLNHPDQHIRDLIVTELMFYTVDIDFMGILSSALVWLVRGDDPLAPSLDMDDAYSKCYVSLNRTARNFLTEAHSHRLHVDGSKGAREDPGAA